MSSTWTLYCENHDVRGPGLRRSAGGTVSFTAQTYEFDAEGNLDWEGTKETGMIEWREFLIEHEYCRPMLIVG